MEIEKILKENGYDVISGYHEVKKVLNKYSDIQKLCSGYRVFPDGSKCSGCKDCIVKGFAERDAILS